MNFNLYFVAACKHGEPVALKAGPFVSYEVAEATKDEWQHRARGSLNVYAVVESEFPVNIVGE